MEELIKIKDCLLAASIGDICGTPWEFSPFKSLTMEGFRECLQYNYPTSVENLFIRYTPLNKHRDISRMRSPHFPYASDDSICTFAVAEALINKTDVGENLAKRCMSDPTRGYGSMFCKWLQSENKQPYNSFGNGSAMRCSSAGWLANTLEEAISLATETAVPTHNHPEGIKGAVSAARAIFRGRSGASKEEIINEILADCDPSWSTISWDNILKYYKFDVTCPGTLPVVALALRESTDFETCILKCIQSGGDTDTLCAIAAPIALSIYREIPAWMLSLPARYLPQWCLEINDAFNKLIGF